MEWHCCYCDTFHIERKSEFLRREKCNILPPFTGQEPDFNTSLLEKPKEGREKFSWLFCIDENDFTSFQPDRVKPYIYSEKKSKPQ